MNEALRDQLRKTGLVNNEQNVVAENKAPHKKKVKCRATRATNSQNKPIGGVPSKRKRTAKVAQTSSPHSHLNKRQREAVRRFLREHRRNTGKGEIPFYFQESLVVRKIWVTTEQRQQLMGGELVIVSRNERYYVLDVALSKELLMLDSKATIIQIEESQSGEDDPAYKEYPIPDDLVW